MDENELFPQQIGIPRQFWTKADILGYQNWPTYRKKVFTHMKRIEGPFTVDTDEGLLTCKDGFIAVDARGYPYPIAADEQALIYERNE